MNQEMKGQWGEEQPLQIDSYATERQLVTAIIVGDSIVIGLTDGRGQWQGKLKLPQGWKP